MRYWPTSLVVIFCGVLVGNSQGQQPGNLRREISVTGRGMITIVPDGLVFKIGVESDGPSVDAVRMENATKVNALLKALRDSGVSESDIVTSNMTLTKRFIPAQESQTRKAAETFKLERDVVVRLRRITGAEDIFAAAMKAGANKVSDFSFTDSKSEQHQDAATALAIKDAIRIADLQTAQFGAKRGKVVWISQDSQRSQGGDVRLIVTGSRIEPPFSIGDINFEVSIYAHFEVE